MKILLSSVGRRGYLVKFFKEALGDNGEVWGGDNTKLAPGFHYCDKCTLLPKVIDPDYIDKLINICSDNHIDMIVPLIDPELEILAAQRQRFFDAGIMVVVSPQKTIDIGFDKYLTYKFGKENGIAVPKTVITVEEGLSLIASGELKWPLVVKPRKGSASANITYCNDETRLKAAFESCPLPMIQEFIDGDEYGYDIFSDKEYRPISVFCKKKLVMRSGETDKAVSTNNQELIGFGLKIVQNLHLFGPLDADIMIAKDGPKLLEINPRFGGGYPCSYLCNANFPAKLIAMFRNETLKPDIGTCPNGIYMLKQPEIVSPSEQELGYILTV
jgi:carbamoyl-phosphate synthase large subunit